MAPPPARARVPGTLFGRRRQPAVMAAASPHCTKVPARARARHRARSPAPRTHTHLAAPRAACSARPADAL
eukprot:348993-Prymnesium_polylepis.1